MRENRKSHRGILPEIDREFRPIRTEWNKFCERTRQGDFREIAVAVRYPGGLAEKRMPVPGRKAGACPDAETVFFVERTAKSMLWICGGFEILVTDEAIASALSGIFVSGRRRFDTDFMTKVFKRPFSVRSVSEEELELLRSQAQSVPDRPLGENCGTLKIGLDLGGSARKCCALSGDRLVWSDSTAWSPSEQRSPDYFLDELRTAIRAAKNALGGADGIGISLAGIVSDQRMEISSLFLGLSDSDKEKLAGFAAQLSKEFGVPVRIMNDGDAATLSGMREGERCVVGTSLGTSQAGGYVGRDGVPAGTFNEFAFVPVDVSGSAEPILWGDDVGCGEQYLSQWGVIRLARKAGMSFRLGDRTVLPEERSPFTGPDLPELMGQFRSAPEAFQRKIFRDLGVILGHGAAWYSEFYEIEKLVLCGGITCGENGKQIRESALEVLGEAGLTFDIAVSDGELGGMQQCLAAARFATCGR